MIYSSIKAIEYFLPAKTLTNQQLSLEFPEWSIEKISEKTGIVQRHIADADVCASDLAYLAAKKLFSHSTLTPELVDFILLCTQSPDYLLPTSACLLQERLGCRRDIGALDFNLGCSGYVYGLSLAKGLIESGQAKNVLLLTAETYSKYLENTDKTVRTIFSDGAAATWVGISDAPCIGSLSFGSDGRGAENLILKNSAARHEVSSQNFLSMNGPELFAFTLEVVPEIVNTALKKANKNLADIDYFVFHQANMYMLEHLRKKMLIPKEKFCVALQDVGNTVSSTIPIALKMVSQSHQWASKKCVMLVGYGVGYSWGAMLVDLSRAAL